MSFDVIVGLGRGIQMLSANAPPAETSSWGLTEDLELCDTNSAHLRVRVPVDDESPYCMVGGGEMILEAACLLIQQYQPEVAVCAYGHRADYLAKLDAPSESEVMSAMLKARFAETELLPEIVVWPRERQLSMPSNTRQELLNLFDLAIERGLDSIAIVAVGVHAPRVATYVLKHMSVYPQYRSLRVVVLEAEEVLLAEDREQYTPRVEALRNSQSFARNWAREATGISKIVRDVYGDAKPQVVT